MKLRDVHVGGRYVGLKGEARTVVRIWNEYAGVVQLEWSSETHMRNGKPAYGKTTPQLFARWAVRFADADAPQGEGAHGDAGAKDQVEACPQKNPSNGQSLQPSNRSISRE